MPAESSIVIITGCPGAGKTTVCQRLAAAEPLGVHIRGDDFFDYFAHLVPPTKPESHAQNTVALAASARAARAYADGGYQVFLDGIFGPWFMEHVLAEIRSDSSTTRGQRPEVSYVVLSVPFARALARAKARESNPAPEEVVTKMFRQFERADAYRAHRLEVGDAEVDEVVERMRAGIEVGAFRIG